MSAKKKSEATEDVIFEERKEAQADAAAAQEAEEVGQQADAAEVRAEAAEQSQSGSVETKEPANLLISMDKYLAAGVHIGTQQREASMKPYIYNVRPDGLSVFNVQLIDARIRTAAKLLGKYAPENVIVVSARDSTRAAADKLAHMIGAVSASERFMPGTLTNPGYSGYMEPEILFTSDPSIDHRAIIEAVQMHLPVVAICDTNNITRNIDLVIPGNNKGRKSIALVFWLLGREVLRARGVLKPDEDPKMTLEEFQPQI